MGIPELLQIFAAALRDAGATRPFTDSERLETCGDTEIADLVAFLGRSLPPDFEAWLRHVDRRLPLIDNYEICEPKHVLAGIEMDAEADYSEQLVTIKRMEDGRFDDGRLAVAYWQPHWIAIAADSCNNQFCVDLASGPNGVDGQLIEMEFQDGQGPYLSQYATLRAMLEAHIQMLTDKRYSFDDEGFIEYQHTPA